MMKRPPTLFHRQPGCQQGVVLVVALVMLVIIALASVAVMRNVMSNDLVAENNRRQGQAMQAAQAALRFCEEMVAAQAMTPAAAAASADTEDWRTFGLWNGADRTLALGGPVRVDAGYLSSNASTSGSVQGNRYSTGNAPRPQCMAQNRSVGTGQTVVVVTARGFSDNFRSDPTTGKTEAGAVVWLQSIIRL